MQCPFKSNGLPKHTHKGSYAFNLGNGAGFSVLDVIKAAEETVKQKIAYIVEERRAGDPPTLVADSRLAQKELNWKADYTQINQIIESAWGWHNHHKNGYNT
jgi:UDP-glucose 4-epimerase